MNTRAILLRYHEIALKGDNRGWFEEKLSTNARKMVRRALGSEDPIASHRLHGRVIVEAEWNETTRDALKRVFGISNFSPMRKVPTERELLADVAMEEFETYLMKFGIPKTFRVKTRRSDKVFPESSMDFDRFIGSKIKEKYPSVTVQLNDPELTVGIELRFNDSFIWTEKVQGAAGLPVGSNARLLSLLSGGIDSPVAAIQVLRRGSPTSYIHFYGAPFVGEEALSKVEDLARIVNRYQPDPQPLHVVHFGKIQEKIALVTPPKMRTLLYRRMMVRIANEVAKKLDCKALVTGESLGQVASQTVENLSTINSASELPILRPLIAYNKEDIIESAVQWNTYSVSIRPALDCCTLFSDRHPVLRSSPALIEEQEKKFSVTSLIQEALDGLEIRRV